MSFNKITIIGNLGRDPELRYTPQGNAVCDFSVAVNERKRDKAGEWQDITTWFKVTFWGKQAENASKYLTKGRQVYVEGRFHIEEWTDRDGNNRFTPAIQGTEIQFLGEGRSESHETTNTSDSSYTPSANNTFADDSTTTATTTNDDDIPF
jgi:single-strand DNA-binding protein